MSFPDVCEITKSEAGEERPALRLTPVQQQRPSVLYGLAGADRN